MPSQVWKLYQGEAQVLNSQKVCGYMYEERIFPIIVFIFYPPYKLSNLAHMKGVLDYLVSLNMFNVIPSFFYILAA